jgi:c-di-GMP-binding flagellar brake protein YcgR
LNTKEIDIERRKNCRVTFSAEVVMQSGNEEWSCNLLDISLKGMLVEPPQELSLDISKPCAVALFLGDDAAIHARVNIIRTDNDTWGLEWLNIDVESLRHLRRLLELNLNDPALIDRELYDLG